MKIFFSVSVGIHLLFLSFLTLLFPGFKIDRLPPLRIEVSFLPLIDKEEPLKHQIKKEEKRLFPNEKKETFIHKRELSSKFSTFQTLATVIPIEESKPLHQQREKEKTFHEFIVTPKTVASPSEVGLAPKKEENPLSIKVDSLIKSDDPGERRGNPLPKVEVLANGRVGQIEVEKSSGYEILVRSALTTVKEWKFIPANQVIKEGSL